jgi:hypothetical protein
MAVNQPESKYKGGFHSNIRAAKINSSSYNCLQLELKTLVSGQKMPKVWLRLRAAIRTNLKVLPDHKPFTNMSVGKTNKNMVLVSLLQNPRLIAIIAIARAYICTCCK